MSHPVAEATVGQRTEQPSDLPFCSGPAPPAATDGSPPSKLAFQRALPILKAEARQDSLRAPAARPGRPPPASPHLALRARVSKSDVESPPARFASAFVLLPRTRSFC